jgi:hypothetical protein
MPRIIVKIVSQLCTNATNHHRNRVAIVSQLCRSHVPISIFVGTPLFQFRLGFTEPFSAVLESGDTFPYALTDPVERVLKTMMRFPLQIGEKE